VAAIFAASSALLRAAEPSADQLEFFEKQIRPIFAENCYTCHSEHAEKLKGGLRLDTSEALLKGGTSGPALVPGQPDSSLLIKAVRYTDPDLRMPPKDKKLPDDLIAKLEAWVKMGAPMASDSVRPGPAAQIAEARIRHWAFRPVLKPSLPAVKR